MNAGDVINPAAWRGEPMTVTRYVRGACPVCGQSTSRGRSFTHHINESHPAVTGDMTLPQARAAVHGALCAEADAWEPDHRHKRCTPKEER